MASFLISSIKSSQVTSSRITFSVPCRVTRSRSERVFSAGESVLGQHEEFIVLVMKKDVKDRNYPDIVDTAETKSRTLEWEGINSYKVYELFKNFRPYVPIEFWSDLMYAKPSPEIWKR